MDSTSNEHTDPTTQTPVTWMITHHVRPDREQEFKKWLSGVAEESARFHGHQGMTVLQPGGGRHPEYVVVVQFATYDDLRRWEQSTQRAHWVRLLEPLLVDRPAYSTQTGLETWFKLPGHAVVVPPPRYKMALLVFVAIYPLILLLLPLLDLVVGDHPYLAAPVELGRDFFISTLVSSLILTVLMTWVAMPQLTRLTGRWLYPTS